MDIHSYTANNKHDTRDLAMTWFGADACTAHCFLPAGQQRRTKRFPEGIEVTPGWFHLDDSGSTPVNMAQIMTQRNSPDANDDQKRL